MGEFLAIAQWAGGDFVFEFDSRETVRETFRRIPSILSEELRYRALVAGAEVFQEARIGDVLGRTGAIFEIVASRE